jgi:hypothetical protein
MQVRTILHHGNNIQLWDEQHMDIDGERKLKDMQKKLDEEMDLYSEACEKLTIIVAEWLGGEG